MKPEKIQELVQDPMLVKVEAETQPFLLLHEVV
jgi:hypothetical protein